MSDDLAKAAGLLVTGRYTCVLCKGDIILTSSEHSLRPLIEWYASGEDMNGFSAADKVVGKAAAFLYVLLGVKEVYAPVMSERAVYTLSRYGIYPSCDTTPEAITDRSGTGICPLEQAVRNINSPEFVLEALLLCLYPLNIKSPPIAILPSEGS